MKIALPRPRRWTLPEYYRLADLGFFDGRRVELIHGTILEMPAMRNDHAVALGLTLSQLEGVFGAGYWVRPQLPLNLGPRSAPEPDLAVVPGQPRDYDDHPTSAVLVVEISDTTLAFDQGRKAALYAAAGIADYWIVNLVERRVEVRRQPAPARRPAKYRYRSVACHLPGETVGPLELPGRMIQVSDLLP